MRQAAAAFWSLTAARVRTSLVCGAASVRTNFEIGASRGMTARLLLAELLLLGAVSAACVGAVLIVLDRFGSALVRGLFVT